MKRIFIIRSSSVLNPQPSVLSPQSSTLSPQHSVLSTQSSIVIPERCPYICKTGNKIMKFITQFSGMLNLAFSIIT